MTRENLQMLFSVVVVTILSLFGSPTSNSVAELETATVAEPIGGLIEDATEANEAQSQSSQDVGEGAQNDAVLPDSFNQGDIENEFSDVEAGIDLLDNPLQ